MRYVDAGDFGVHGNGLLLWLMFNDIVGSM